MRRLRQLQGVTDGLPGIRNTRFQTKATRIEVPQITFASTFARLPVSNPCLGTLILCRLRRFCRGFSQPLPHVAVFFDESFDSLGTHTLMRFLLKQVHHLFQIFGMLLQVLVDLGRFLWREARRTSRTRVIIQADQPGALPALKPLRHGVSRALRAGSDPAHRKALMAQQETMGAHASTPRGMQVRHVGQGWDFHVAERGHPWHRRGISSRKIEGVRWSSQVWRTLAYHPLILSKMSQILL